MQDSDHTSPVVNEDSQDVEGLVPEDDGTGFVRASQEIQKASQEPPSHAQASPEVPHELPGVQQFPSAQTYWSLPRLVIWQAGK